MVEDKGLVFRPCTAIRKFLAAVNLWFSPLLIYLLTYSKRDLVGLTIQDLSVGRVDESKLGQLRPDLPKSRRSHLANSARSVTFLYYP
jgi:hypothetical protein